jgi:hypothetical protein
MQNLENVAVCSCLKKKKKASYSTSLSMEDLATCAAEPGTPKISGNIIFTLK